MSLWWIRYIDICMYIHTYSFVLVTLRALLVRWTFFLLPHSSVSFVSFSFFFFLFDAEIKAASLCVNNAFFGRLKCSPTEGTIFSMIFIASPLTHSPAKYSNVERFPSRGDFSDAPVAGCTTDCFARGFPPAVRSFSNWWSLKKALPRSFVGRKIN